MYFLSQCNANEKAEEYQREGVWIINVSEPAELNKDADLDSDKTSELETGVYMSYERHNNFYKVEADGEEQWLISIHM